MEILQGCGKSKWHWANLPTPQLAVQATRMWGRQFCLPSPPSGLFSHSSSAWKTSEIGETSGIQPLSLAHRPQPLTPPAALASKSAAPSRHRLPTPPLHRPQSARRSPLPPTVASRNDELLVSIRVLHIPYWFLYSTEIHGLILALKS